MFLLKAMTEKKVNQGDAEHFGLNSCWKHTLLIKSATFHTFSPLCVVKYLLFYYFFLLIR